MVFSQIELAHIVDGVLNLSIAQMLVHRDMFMKFIGNTQSFLRDQIAEDKVILCEGAQGSGHRL